MVEDSYEVIELFLSILHPFIVAYRKLGKPGERKYLPTKINVKVASYADACSRIKGLLDFFVHITAYLTARY